MRNAVQKRFCDVPTDSRDFADANCHRAIADEVVRNQYFTGKFFVLYILRIQTQTG
jgi:hypothetical protein